MKKIYDVLMARKNDRGEVIKTKEGKKIYDNRGAIIEDDKGYKKLVLNTMHGEVWFYLYESKPKVEEPKGDIDSDLCPF